MSVDLAKVRPGDLVLVYSPMRGDGSGQGSSANGLYLVLKVGATYAEVIPTSLDQSRTSAVRASEILGAYRAFVGDISELPVRPLNLDKPLPVPAPSAAPAPEPEPQFVKLIVVARKLPVGIVRPKTETSPQVETNYTGRLVGLDSAGQEHREFEVDSRDVDRFLQTQGSYRPGSGGELEAALKREPQEVK